MQLLNRDGVFVVGVVEDVGPVRYGPNHESKAGQEVPGFYRLKVSNPGFARECSFNKVDRDSGELTSVYRELVESDDKIGRRVVLRVGVSSQKEWTSVNFTAVAVEILSDSVADNGADTPAFV